MNDLFVGVDVQVARGCCFYAIDADGKHCASGWVPADDTGHATVNETPRELRSVILDLCNGDLARVAVGIDAPRQPLPAPRAWKWNGSGRSAGAWTRASAGMLGRHCEVVISACKLANPQWTPLAARAPMWMQLGFALFAAFDDVAALHEVFPSASYRQLDSATSASLELDFAHFARGPKDMLDAALGALTVREYMRGNGCAVGGGDGLGTIILPRALALDTSGAHAWPSLLSPARPSAP